MKKMLIGMMALFVSMSALADNPTIIGVKVQQRWPWSRLVNIDYELKCDPGELMDIIVEAYDGLDLLALPSRSLSGDLCAVTKGHRRIVWDPMATPYSNNGLLPEFRVTLTPTPVSLYMIVDLTKSAGEAGQTEYVYESDLTNGVWGAWERDPVTHRGTAIESVIWTGVTTNDIYKTDKLVLRRISKGTFAMGGANPPTLSTTLTKDFYAGVFQVTQRQWELIMGNKPSTYNNPAYYKTRPVETVSYDNIRGATSSIPGIDWPRTGTLVLPFSFLGKLRTKTGLADFDLPTDAQWDYACRAGTTTLYNDGNAAASMSGNNAYTNEWLDVLGRYKYNGGLVWNGTEEWVAPETEEWVAPETDCGPENGTAIVGQYLPNAWGLYDMHGNICEWCLDWIADLEGGKDPKGAESGEMRVFRNGNWVQNALYSRSMYRVSLQPTVLSAGYGLRLVRPVP